MKKAQNVAKHASAMIRRLAIWPREANTFGWRSYLGGRYGDDDIPYLAAPARATDLSGLPPAFIAVGAADGVKIWEYPTAKEFETINRVQPAHGGAISTSGAVVVDGMVYVGSGYAVGSGASGGNVLLAFGVE